MPVLTAVLHHKKSTSALGFAALVLIGFTVLALGRTGLATTASAPVSRDVRTISAHRLYADYAADEASADAQYRDRELSVSGTLGGMSQDFHDRPYLILRAPGEFMGIHAGLQDGQSTIAANLHQAARIKLLCRGDGQQDGSPILEDCVIQ